MTPSSGYVLGEWVTFLCLGFVPEGDEMTLKIRRHGEAEFTRLTPLSSNPNVFAENNCVDSISTIFQATVQNSWNNSDVACQVLRTQDGQGSAAEEEEVVLAGSDTVPIQVIDSKWSWLAVLGCFCLFLVLGITCKYSFCWSLFRYDYVSVTFADYILIC